MERTIGTGVTLGSFNKLVVSAYKVLGFGILTLLLVGLLSFIGLNAFFFLNRSWVAPTILSPTDERVLALSAQLAQQTTARDRLVAERAELDSRMELARRAVASQKAFQADFRQAIASDLAARRDELQRLERRRADFAGAKHDITRSNSSYAAVARRQLEQTRRAHIIDDEGYVAAGHQLAQVAQNTLSLEESEAQLRLRSAELRRDLTSLESILAAVAAGREVTAGRELSYVALQMKDAYSQSTTALALAHGEETVAAAALAANTSAVERFDRILRTIQDSPYLKAADGRITLAFVPYDNVSAARPDAPLQACSLSVVLCRKVGRVVSVVDGEVAVRHPLRSEVERGLMVRVELDDPRWAKQRILFAGRAPLFI